MPTKKQTRAQQKRRHEQYEAKTTARRTRRQHRQQIAGAVTVGALVLGGGTVTLMAMDSPTGNPAPSASTPPTSPLAGYAEGREWTATIETDQGPLSIRLDGVAAPTAVGSFVNLAQQGYFDGSSCYRLLTEGIFVLQCGNQTGDEYGDPGYPFGPVENAPVDSFYPAGTVAMARTSDPYSMDSQFFIVYQDSYIGLGDPYGYTVFGEVTDGLGIVESIAAAGTETGSSEGPPAEPVVLREVSVS